MDHSYFDEPSLAQRPWTLRTALRERAAALLGRPPVRSTPSSHQPLSHQQVHVDPIASLDASGPRPRRAAASTEALALEHIRHRYTGMTAVDDVSLSIAHGEILCLVGPSGCGKSTLLRIAAGLEALQRGTVRINGKVVADATGCMPPERRGVGLVFQDYALFPHLSVIDNVRFGLSGQPAQQQRRRAMETLEQVGMGGYADHFPHALSGGQQQRVALARALAPNPAVLLLDEPFSGLDVRLREQVRDETLHVLKRTGAATMLVTHDPEEAMFLADRIALMRAGKMVQLGSPVDLYNRPADGFAASFFGEVNRIVGAVRQGAVDTPVGRIPTDLPEGSTAQVMIRPEALHLSPLEGSGGAIVPNIARVMASRLLGRTSLVHLSIPNGQGGCHLHSRMPGQFLPNEESHVAITVDTRQAFVFPAKEPT
jgi:iron(III) transport system ATP-binding protein